jgi:hypothetical protein
MTDEMELAHMDIYAEGTIYQPSQTKKRSLGAAIFLVAIEDYRSTDEEDYRTAERFLYPQTRRWQEHHDWALALADELNPAWLRDALDRFKSKWDMQREQHTARETRRALQRCFKSDRRNRPNEKQRAEQIHPDGGIMPANHTRSFDPSFQPARETCSERPGDVAPGS